MSETTVGRRAAERLIEDKETLARAVIEKLYAETPALIAKYGEHGRKKCLEDMRHNIDFLVPAVDLGDGNLFAQYTSWLFDMLASRAVDAPEVARSLELLADEARTRYDADESGLIGEIVGAGLAATSKSA